MRAPQPLFAALVVSDLAVPRLAAGAQTPDVSTLATGKVVTSLRVASTTLAPRTASALCDNAGTWTPRRRSRTSSPCRSGAKLIRFQAPSFVGAHAIRPAGPVLPGNR